ncbi:hypothetical protein LTR94_030500, partial [Friedmanniomyces endolithicus]
RIVRARHRGAAGREQDRRRARHAGRHRYARCRDRGGRCQRQSDRRVEHQRRRRQWHRLQPLDRAGAQHRLPAPRRRDRRRLLPGRHQQFDRGIAHQRRDRL